MADPGTSNGGRPPNIVFVLTDDQGYGDLGCHGNPYIQTPNIDRLHGESARLTDFHVGPTCSPTRAGLLTGHYANSTGVWHTVGGRSLLRQGERTLADYLRDAGYVTGLFGKWHLGDAYPYRPQDRGFQEVVTHGGGGVGNTPDYWGNNYTDDHYCHNGVWEPYDGYCTDVWFRLAMAFIEQHRQEPFFCLLTPNAPHLPHIVPERYSRPYRELAEADPDAARFFHYPMSDQMLKFYGMVTCIDDNVGRLRAHLEALGLAENTILVFMTDNGSAGGLVRDREQFIVAGYNAGMRGGKATPYEGGHRVPFFLHWPAGDYRRGLDVPTLSANVDVVPTLLDLCGVPYDPARFHGHSLAPLLDGTAAGPEWAERTMVTDSQRLLNPIKWRLSCAMRGRWRLICGRELYDLASDREQRHDVAAAQPALVEQLRGAYEDWWRLVSGRVEEELPIPLGDPAAPRVVLTCHDWRREPESGEEIGIFEYRTNTRAPSNQCQVREGAEWTGYWEVEVMRPGPYRIELRRWPREADLGLAEGIPGEIKPHTDTIASGYGGGRAIPVRRAAVRIAGHAAEQEVTSSKTAAWFDITLPAGPTHLETALYTADDTVLSAYYVYVEPAT